MKPEQVNIHEAKTHLSRLLQRVAEGHDVLIAKAGKPVARMTRADSPPKSKPKRLGFMKGQGKVPDDFDRMAQEDIEKMFYGSGE